MNPLQTMLTDRLAQCRLNFEEATDKHAETLFRELEDLIEQLPAEGHTQAAAMFLAVKLDGLAALFKAITTDLNRINSAALIATLAKAEGFPQIALHLQEALKDSPDFKGMTPEALDWLQDLADKAEKKLGEDHEDE